MVISGAMSLYAGTACLTSCKLPFPTRMPEMGHFGPRKCLRMPILRSPSTGRRIVCATGGRDQWRQLQSRNDYDPEPFWLSLIKDVIWSFRSLVIFLAEQPSQLKYIEWPSFQSTIYVALFLAHHEKCNLSRRKLTIQPMKLMTATLTLVIVALLIIALSSIDSALCYILALLLRRRTRPL